MNNTLNEVFNRNCHFTQCGMIDDVMETIHPQSLSYEQSRLLLEQLANNYQLEVVPRNFNYIGKDDEFAYAKAIQEVTKISGPAFKDSKTTQLVVFKKDKDDWRIWAISILNIEYLD